MSTNHLSISSSNGFYLQSMGIDLYQFRQVNDADDVTKIKRTASNSIAQIKNQLKNNASTVKVTTTNKPAFVVSIDDVQQSQLFTDLCLALKVDVDAIVRIDDSCFEVGPLQWQFDAHSHTIAFNDNKLTSGTLDTLCDGQTKARLYQCLKPLLNK